MLKTIGWLLFSLALAALTGSVTAADDAKPRTITRTLTGGEFWMLPEVGAVAIEKDGKLSFDMVSPADGRAKGYESVDIRQGDVILMANGKKIAGAKDMKALYDGLAVGEELKLGIRRGEDMMIATVKKADPATLPQRRMVVKGSPDGDEKMVQSSSQHVLKIDDDAKDVTPVSDAGIIIGTKDGDLMVLELLPSAKEILGDAAIAKGDKVIALQGKPVKSVTDFTAGMDAITIGEPVTITLNHAGKELKASFTKPEAMYRTVIKKN